MLIVLIPSWFELDEDNVFGFPRLSADSKRLEVLDTDDGIIESVPSIDLYNSIISGKCKTPNLFLADKNLKVLRFSTLNNFACRQRNIYYKDNRLHYNGVSFDTSYTIFVSFCFSGTDLTILNSIQTSEGIQFKVNNIRELGVVESTEKFLRSHL